MIKRQTGKNASGTSMLKSKAMTAKTQKVGPSYKMNNDRIKHA